MAGLLDAQASTVEQVDSVERVESGPERAGTNGEVAGQRPSDHSERVYVAMRPQVGTRDLCCAGWHRVRNCDEPALLWRATRIDLLQHERKAAVPGRPACQHRQREGTAASRPA